MNIIRLKLRICSWCLGLAAALTAMPTTRAQLPYLVEKIQAYSQTSNAGAMPDLNTPFAFNAQATVSVTLHQQNGVHLLPFSSDDGIYEYADVFATKALLDAAFPNGTYYMSGANVPLPSFNLATEMYPTATPQILNGIWSGGLLVLAPEESSTITFSAFTGYANTGVAGRVSFQIKGLFDNVNLRSDIATQTIANATASATPLTAFTVSPSALTNGRVYQAELQFDTISSLGTAGSAAGIFGKTLRFYIAAVTPGTTAPAPAITAQPMNQTGVAGGSATFNIVFTVGGSAPTNYVDVRWSFDGQQLKIDGTKYSTTNSADLTVNNLTAADAGSYSAKIITAGGTVTSSIASLTFSAPGAPTFSRQPFPAITTIAAGSTAVFVASAAGSTAPTLQWRKNDMTLPGATNNTLVLPNVHATDAGLYTVVATNSSGTTLSETADLIITTTTDVGRLSNLSIRANAGSDAQTLIVGFTISGAATIGTKSVLIRGVGPALAIFGVPGLLVDPVLNVFDASNATIATNDDWNVADATSMASVGAFALPANSRDSAIVASALVGGGYTAQITGKAGDTGIALAEVYDTESVSSASTLRLINVSARAQVGTGAGILATGFVISGSTSRTVLIRAIGPSLLPFGVAGVLTDPVLMLYNVSSRANSDHTRVAKAEIDPIDPGINGPPILIATNDDWGGDSQLTNVSESVGAFRLVSSTSKDSVLLVTLAPGNYTAEVSGTSNTTGIALVEVYAVP